MKCTLEFHIKIIKSAILDYFHINLTPPTMSSSRYTSYLALTSDTYYNHLKMSNVKTLKKLVYSSRKSTTSDELLKVKNKTDARGSMRNIITELIDACKDQGNRDSWRDIFMIKLLKSVGDLFWRQVTGVP